MPRQLASRAILALSENYACKMLPAAAGWQPGSPGRANLSDSSPGLVSSTPPGGKALVRAAVLRQFRPVMAANRKLGCLSIFLFVALCASLFFNLLLMATAFQRLGGIREPEANSPFS